jgi:SAM-dependent methyltransferase
MNARDYDNRIDWEKRLAGERPFYEKLFQDHNIMTVLDCACGPGRHAIMLAKSGVSVTGIDMDPGMIEQAEKNASETVRGVTFQVAGFNDLASVFRKERFDMVMCVGNSLSQLPGLQQVEHALWNMSAVCRNGGMLVIHILNYCSLLKQELVVKPLRVEKAKDGYVYYQKIFLPRKDAVDVLMCTVKGVDGRGESDVHRGKLLPIMPADLERIVKKVGLSVMSICGDYKRHPFEREHSRDLILTARRGG